MKAGECYDPLCEKHKPKWTAEYVANMIGLQAAILAGRKVHQSIADAHNAALAAEREESAKWRSEAGKTNELRQQLAAEKKETENVANQWIEAEKGFAVQIVELRQQLAAEREKVETLVNGWRAFRNELAVYDIGFLRRNTRLTEIFDAALAKVGEGK